MPLPTSHRIDMLHGPLVTRIIAFALPIAASSLLQQLFNSVDLAVVGHFARQEALALCREILSMERCEVLISGANTSYLCPKQQDIVDHIRYFVGNNTALLSAPEEVGEEILKVSAYCRTGAVQTEPLLSPKWGREFQCAVAGEKWLDFTLADKGTGLQKLCAAVGIPPETVGLISREKIALMKPTAYLVNTARAKILAFSSS